MRSTPLSLIAATLLGAAVGLILSLNGLLARLSGAFLEGGWLGTMWSEIPAALRLDHGAWALTVVILGLMMWGAFGALWARSTWGRPAALILACLSLPFFPVVSALAAVVLLLLLLPASRAWGTTPS
jgi:hypothetical protein